MRYLILAICVCLFSNSSATDTDSVEKRLTLTTPTSKIFASWNQFSEKDESCTVQIYFAGEIGREDVDAFKKIVDASCLETKKNEQGFISYQLSLDSKGGDVGAALEIGRLMRYAKFAVKDIRFLTRVEHDRKCHSACVFLLAAGLGRSVWGFGKVGIHRPYFAQLDTNYSTAEIRQIRSVQNKAIREYLVEMDIADSLLDAMLAVSSDKIKVLTEDELRQFRLNVDDANFEEQNTARLASHWYLTSSEYRTRNSLVNERCVGFKNPFTSPEFKACEASIMLKISKEEYFSRTQRESECTPLFENIKYSHTSLPAIECIYRIRAGK